MVLMLRKTISYLSFVFFLNFIFYPHFLKSFSEFCVQQIILPHFIPFSKNLVNFVIHHIFIKFQIILFFFLQFLTIAKRTYLKKNAMKIYFIVIKRQTLHSCYIKI